jgi:hypothetical protein
MRYWKARYDEDALRDYALRGGDESPPEEDRDIRFFHVLIALQVALVSFVLLLIVNWR